jgi:hypothetical protein
MADHAILNAARELQAWCEAADRDVQRELGLMSVSVAEARATTRKIGESASTTRRHADAMAQQLAADLQDAAAVLESSRASERLVTEALGTVESDRWSAIASADSPERQFAVPLPPARWNVAKRIADVRLLAPSPSWDALVDQRQLAEELARAAADVAALSEKAREETGKQTQPAPSPRETKETA